LSPGHRHRIVIDDLVGDVDAGCHRLADRKRTTVKPGSVAKVGKDVLLSGEGCLTYPRNALTSHLREGRGGAVHPDRHVVAAYPGDRTASFRHPGTCVVRTPAAEPGRPSFTPLLPV
jgi:hypothetical protein